MLWSVIDFPIIPDARGSLTFVEAERHIPFELRRVYYLYDVPNGSVRAGHAHKELSSVILALSGSFNIHLDDGVNKETITLNRPAIGVLLKPKVWRSLDNFSSGAVCLVLASHVYDEEDYFRNYSD